MYRSSTLAILLFFSLFFNTGCEKDNEIPLKEELVLKDVEVQETFINKEEIKNFFSDDFLARKNRFRSHPESGRSADQVSDLIDVIQYDLSKDDESLINVQALINSLGYIDWTSYLHFLDDSGDQISFPIYKENSSKVNGVFMFYISSGNVKYHLTHRGKINSHLNNDDWRDEYPNLYFSVFNLWDFDLRVFDRENNRFIEWLNENDPNDFNIRITSTSRGIECYTVLTCPACPPPNHAARDENETTRDAFLCCTSTTYCNTYEDDIPPIDGGGDGGSGSGGGGSSGGGSSNTDALPDGDILSTLEKVNNLETIYPISSTERFFLLNSPSITDAIYNAHNASVNSLSSRPGLMFDNLEDAIPTNDLIDVMVELAFLKLSHPGWQNDKLLHSWLVIKASLNVALDKTHIILGTVGLIPGVGEVADFADAGIYALQGDKEGAFFSLAATVPFAGWASRGAQAFKIVRTADGKKLTLWLKGDSDGIIRFTNGIGTDLTNARNQLRKNLGIPSGSGTAAHHMIPWEHRTNRLVQKAAQDGKFHMNAKGNGFDLDIARHQDNHNGYNALVLNHMNDIFDPNMTPEDAFNVIVNIQNRIRNQLEAGKSLSQIILP